MSSLDMYSFFPFILAHWTRYFLASSALPLASSQRADSGSHLNTDRGNWLLETQTLMDWGKKRCKSALLDALPVEKTQYSATHMFTVRMEKLLLISTLPPGDNGSNAGRRHRQHQVSPVSYEVGQQGQEHVPHAPRQTHDGTSEGPVLHICPLDPWPGSEQTDFSEIQKDFCLIENRTTGTWIMNNMLSIYRAICTVNLLYCDRL